MFSDTFFPRNLATLFVGATLLVSPGPASAEEAEGPPVCTAEQRTLPKATITCPGGKAPPLIYWYGHMIGQIFCNPKGATSSDPASLLATRRVDGEPMCIVTKGNRTSIHYKPRR